MSDHSRSCLLCAAVILVAGARGWAESRPEATTPVSFDAPAPLTAQPQMTECRDACCPSNSGTCNACCFAPSCPSDRVWFTGEYLFWFLKDAPVPVPLLTTGPTASAGIIGKT